MRTHCVHGGRGGQSCCVRTHFFKYSANVFIFDKYHIIVEYKHIYIKETIYKPLYYTFYISMKIAFVRTGGGGSRQMRTHCVQGWEGGSKILVWHIKKLLNFMITLFIILISC